MNEAEKATTAVTLAVHEELLTQLMAVLFRQKSAEERQALLRALEKGPSLKENAMEGMDIGAADDFAGHALEYHEVLSRILKDAAARAGG